MQNLGNWYFRPYNGGGITPPPNSLHSSPLRRDELSRPVGRARDDRFRSAQGETVSYPRMHPPLSRSARTLRAAIRRMPGGPWASTWGVIGRGTHRRNPP